MKGKLYIVPTPIGNLEDITFRAIRILKEADLILAEDTRTSSVLLRHYGITTKAISHHKFNEHAQVQQLAQEIAEGKQIALISDAGTPAISDPGYLIVRTCLDHALPVETLPGATAFVPALVNAGLPMHEFVFIGFLPQKKGRETKLRSLAAEQRTMILYEAPQRVVKLLEQLLQHLGDRRASVSRELSKKFEETQRGLLSELIKHFSEKEPKGEFVIVVEGLQD
ncbi:MAG TPA: 16S rRNA (cytidine(1402)-2'-O)-methyltransferase [Chitinophagales bacterium]|nr:16S rRNA (cytidine(1402)-2'-O)-methyltransferase [Chitinophagales bacterium]HNE45519.1 16S rRNA (cytidine(1402)-2'-O)-methyltransferase [Chitinophagales bacterium]HNI53672.1 16S rRNA (cytidine(1402)-2'-O)-methyltransferase [Chitinophagales bacterium]HNJ88221.1 16S rRNA (cytidine(1402)-2'-O)-methyltransferase [Chitinophagales bacterium]HNM07746.1 16S rRNA (cytidine(1402)-2'-O)-methyltransferase [Chitinophagales bacterium]